MKNLLLIIVLLLTGCGHMTILEHPETKDIRICEVTGREAAQALAFAKSTHDRCVQNWERMGYKAVTNEKNH